MKILAQIIACIVFGTILGVVFWLCDGGKTCPKVSEGLERASQAQEYEIKGVLDEIRVTRGVWHKDFLEVIK